MAYRSDIPAPREGCRTTSEVLIVAEPELSFRIGPAFCTGPLPPHAKPDPIGRITVPTRIQLRPDITADHAARLRLPVALALYNFWVSQNGGLTPFAFYNPLDVAGGQQIGSNYDLTGNNTQGRVTVVFRGNWTQATDIARTNAQGLELVQVPVQTLTEHGLKVEGRPGGASLGSVD